MKSVNFLAESTAETVAAIKRAGNTIARRAEDGGAKALIAKRLGMELVATGGLNLIAEALGNVSSQKVNDGWYVPTYSGLIAISDPLVWADVAPLVSDLNLLKERFGSEYKELQKIAGGRLAGLSALKEVIAKMRSMEIRNVTLNAKAVGRKVILIDEPVSRMRFYAEKERRVERVDMEKLAREVATMNPDYADYIHGKLAHVRNKDSLRRVVESDITRQKVNIKAGSWVTKTATLPVIIRASDLPEVLGLDTDSGKNVTRRDKAVYNPVIPELNIYEKR